MPGPETEGVTPVPLSEACLQFPSGGCLLRSPLKSGLQNININHFLNKANAVITV